MSKLESSVFYELCGLSGSGKTQICSIISADLALNGNKVYYIDTKNEFNVDEICVRISQKTDSKEVRTSLNRYAIFISCTEDFVFVGYSGLFEQNYCN